MQAVDRVRDKLSVGGRVTDGFQRSGVKERFFVSNML